MIELSAEAKRLLLESSYDECGTVRYVNAMEGVTVQTNGHQILAAGDSRSAAKWKSALDDLVAIGLLEPLGYEGESFGLTEIGYDVAYELRKRGGHA